MRLLLPICLAIALSSGSGAARAAQPGESQPATTPPTGRVGLLPEAWVQSLESNNLSEQTALIAGGATVAAVGTGVAMAAAGATTGGIAGATLFTLWLAHIPIQMAVMGTGGYLAWSYLAPADKPAACEPGAMTAAAPLR